MKKILFSHSLITSKACHKRHFQMKNNSTSICSKVTLTSRFQYMSTEVANRAERVKENTLNAIYSFEVTTDLVNSESLKVALLLSFDMSYKSAISLCYS